MFYPIVKCQRHKPEPGYAVCGHVLNDGAPVGVLIAATRKEMGQILCGHEDCTLVENIFPVCAQCARGRGWVK